MTKKLTKRFVSFLVTLAMTVALLPIIPAMAADEVTDVTTFAKTLDSTYNGEDTASIAVSGNTVTLLQDITLEQGTDRPVIKSGEYQG